MRWRFRLAVAALAAGLLAGTHPEDAQVLLNELTP